MSTVVNVQTYSAHMDYSYSRHSNSAGAPLPRIPRRTSCSRSGSLSATSSAPSSPPATIQRVLSAEASYFSTPFVPTVLVVQPPTPPRPEAAVVEARNSDKADASSSSSSSSESYVQMNPRARRIRTPKMQSLRPPADSTPTPAVLRARTAAQEKSVVFPARQASTDELSGNETPRASSTLHSATRPDLYIDLDDLRTPLPVGGSSKPTAAATSGVTIVRAEEVSSSRAVSAPHAWAANIARKKSGEPLKSSLKSRRPVVRGDLSVVTGGIPFAATKSEPTTPKSVHFDKHLEHVKLFLAEQKPLAISREGSPTDTSGTESDFPSSIYGRNGNKEDDKALTMQVTNMPAVPRAEADVTLEDLTLSTDGMCLNGSVRLRNIAFEKWVAVRFTVDWWQTTSEVTAKYLDSTPGGTFDRFTFTIRLADYLARIEEKTMFFALRYNVVGREIWDNNDGQNYKVTFAKVSRPQVASSSSDASLASLKSKLESVVKGQETVGGFMAQGGRKAAPFTLEASTSLSARYDFAASLKSPWRRSPPASSGTPSKPAHMRNVTHPATFPGLKRAGKQAAFDDTHSSRQQALSRGSPRILDHDDNSPIERPASFYANSELEDTPVPVITRRRNRNHQRGYFDLGLSQAGGFVKRTPTTSPTSSSSPTSSIFSPTTLEQAIRTPEQPRSLSARMWFLERGGSEDSTPSATSNSESSSPSGSPMDDGLTFGFEGIRSPPESDSYSVFLNKYCYYTGSTDDSFLDSPQDVIHRSHSASSVEEFLAMSPNPGYLLPGETPTRSSSYDDVMSIGSGTTTPTLRSAGFVGLVESPVV